MDASRTRGYTVSVHDVQTFTTPVLPALCDYSLRPRPPQPSGPNAQCPTNQPWFAFPHRSLSACSFSPWLLSLSVLIVTS